MLFDFKCPNGHITERFVHTDTNQVPCGECESMSLKIISAPRLLRMDGMPINIHGDEWARVRERNFKRTKERDG